MFYPHKSAKTGGLFTPTRVYDNIGKIGRYLESRVTGETGYLDEFEEDIGDKQLGHNRGLSLSAIAIIGEAADPFLR
jgi:hypothetical protein